MSGGAWTMLSPRGLTPEGGRITETRRTARRERPDSDDERGVDRFRKGWTATGRSSGEGGGAMLTPEDVKHALGGLREAPYRFGMAAFLGDAHSLRLTENHLVTEIRWHAEAGGWLTSRSQVETVERMASVMLFEVISAMSRHETFAHQKGLPEGSAAVRCPQCLGKTEYVPISEAASGRAYGRATPCDLCEDGVFVLDDPARARLCGLSLKWWRSIWSGRYAELIDIPRRWEAIAISHVRRRLAIREDERL